MSLSAQTNRRISTLLWIAVGILVGATAATLLSVDGRQTLFFILLGAGAATLIRVNQKRPGRAVPAPSAQKQSKPMTAVATAPETTPVVSPATQQFTTESLANDHVLTEAEARRWLDDLLQQQQK